MMHLHIDCQFGIAGDMLLAALVDAGTDVNRITAVLKDVLGDEFVLECVRTTRSGVASMLADVTDKTAGRCCGGGHRHDEQAPVDPHHHDHSHDHSHHHGHSHGHPHGHPHQEGAESGHRHGHGPHRHLSDLMSLLDNPAIPALTRERAARVFHIIAEAEATVHGVALDKVHFHEISGIDTAVDVIGSCLALEFLDVQSISASPPSVGSGMVMCEHGIFPVPAPATLEILKSRNIPWRSGGDGERATPTGIGLLAGLVDAYGESPEVTVTRIGYGAGHREFPDVPNLVRVIVGKPGRYEAAEKEEEPAAAAAPSKGDLIHVNKSESFLPAGIARMLPAEGSPENDRVVEFRFAVDDMTPEMLAYLCETCLTAGALEAYAIPAVMKKGRSGHEITVLAAPAMASIIADVIWSESTTFGMRVSERSRLVLARDFRTVTVLGHKVRIKLGWRAGILVRRQPEYEDCRAAAAATGKTLREIYSLAERESQSVQ